MRRRSPSICSTAVGLWVLGRRLRPGPQGRRLGDRARLRLARLPVHALHDERQRERFADRAAPRRRDARADVGAGAGRRRSRSPRRPSSAPRRSRRCSRPEPASGDGGRRSSFGVVFVAVCAGARHPVPPARRSARVLRPHAGLPGVPKLAVQRLGPGAVARTSSSPPSGSTRRSSRVAVALLAPAQDPGPDRGARGGGVIAVQLGATHWFYFYVVWFLPLALAAMLLGAARRRADACYAIRVSSRPSVGELIAISSPGLSHTRGSRVEPTPDGVPVDDDVAGLERHQPREVGDQLRACRRSGRRSRRPA